MLMVDQNAPKFEVKITVAHDKANNVLESSLTTTPGIEPACVWEALKVSVTHMLKAAQYVGDPIAREQMEIAGKAMKAIVVGTEATIEKLRKSQENQQKEMGA